MATADVAQPGARSKAQGFVGMQELFEEKHKAGNHISVFGVVTRVRQPIRASGGRQNGGGDFKISVYLTDLSLEESGNTICFNIFLPDEDNLPKFQLADVVIVKDALVQAPRWDMCYSLLLRPRTRIHIYRAQPSSPSTLKYMPWQARPKYVWLKNAPNPPPTAVEQNYALYIHKEINKGALPDITTFEQEVAQSLQVRDKRKELKDVYQGMYCDLLVQVVSEPHITDYPYAMLWVSDYTENSAFEHKGEAATASAAAAAAGTRTSSENNVGDSNGYLTKYGAEAARANARSNDKTGNSKTDDDYRQWRGPVGRRSMFMVCFPPHAQFIQEKVKRGSWITMRNVQIKSNDNRIEGVMGTDTIQGSPLRVALVPTEGVDRESIDPRFLHALLRKKNYEKGCRAEAKKRKALHNASTADDSSAAGGNSKQRRKMRRQDKQGSASKNESKANASVVCSFSEQPVVPLSLALDPSLYLLDVKGDEEAAAATSKEAVVPTTLPFSNIKFKTQVRVVDFLPKLLPDFAVLCRKDEYAILGNDGDSSGSSSSEDDEGGVGVGVGEGKSVWEWRFALLLEDASSATTAPPNDKEVNMTTTAPARVWAVVNNFHGQTLLNQDACDLRKDSRSLNALRERLFLLWGNLEELKRKTEKKARTAQEAKAKQAKQDEEQQAANAKAKDKEEQARERVAVMNESLLKYPKPACEDSEGDDDGTPSAGKQQTNKQRKKQQQQQQQQQEQQQEKQASADQPDKPEQLVSRPFVCCLQQYGVLDSVCDRDNSSDDSGEDSGKPKKVWRQTFGMFGTTIRQYSGE